MKKTIYWISFVLFFFIVVGAYLWFVTTPYYGMLIDWSRQNIIAMMMVLIVVKILGIIIPPIPGGVITVGAVPFIGWQLAFLSDFIGGMIGSVIAYYLGKKYGRSILEKLFDQKAVDKIYTIRIKPNREIESIFVLRFLFGSLIAEVICYAAGVLGVNFKSFVIGSIIYHIAIGVPAYFLVSNLLHNKNMIFNLILLVIAVPLFFVLRKRYFETTDEHTTN
jgi:uncharacterized membrane protein YdjX (TVP38/TMEM64 family)